MTNTAPRIIRWTILLLSGLLFILFWWLLDFVIEDIDNRQGPNYQTYRSAEVGTELTAQDKGLREQQASIKRDLARQQEIKKARLQKLQNAREDWGQRAGEHRLELEAKRQPTEQLRQDLAEARKRITDAQATVEAVDAKLAELSSQKYTVGIELEEAGKKIKAAHEKADEKHEEALRRYNFIVASWKLAFIVPFFLAAAWLVLRKRKSIYRPILLALLLASFWQLGSVMGDHFPLEFFKYIAIAAAIVITLAFLVRLLRSAARPRPDVQLKQRRESYHKDICPICSHPFPHEHGKAFTCPSCGTGLFSDCAACSGSRHSLLPFCIHCGAEA